MHKPKSPVSLPFGVKQATFPFTKEKKNKTKKLVSTFSFMIKHPLLSVQVLPLGRSRTIVHTNMQPVPVGSFLVGWQ